MQGTPMAQRLLDADWSLTIYARRSVTLEPFLETRAVIVESLPDLGNCCDLVEICVVDDEQVEEVLIGKDALLEAMRPNSIIAIHSTVHPDTCKRLAGIAAEQSVVLIDAPVSGGPRAALAGSLAVMVGGDLETFRQCEPIFQAFGNPVRHVGPVGAGQLTKLVNNLVFTANLALAHDAISLGIDFGLDPVALTEILLRGSAASFGLQVFQDRHLSLPELGASAGPLLRKDVSTVLEVARAADADPGALSSVAVRTLELFSSDST
jgi:3-hydroxyisobutyrate dehydrogenase-like beta-hydroxyacid dehydrogenase